MSIQHHNSNHRNQKQSLPTGVTAADIGLLKSQHECQSMVPGKRDQALAPTTSISQKSANRFWKKTGSLTGSPKICIIRRHPYRVRRYHNHSAGKCIVRTAYRCTVSSEVILKEFAASPQVDDRTGCFLHR